MTANRWAIEHTKGSAGAFHGRPPPLPLRPTAWVHVVDRRALVLGSTQRAPIIDEAAAAEHGIEVCRRRSGGGLVFVDPGSSLWIDVIVPRGDQLWSDDVSLAFDWVGQTWASALRAADAGSSISVHRGRVRHADWGRTICFAGLGPGEVVVDGRKVVGLSQRRTRDAARFQGLAVTRFDAGVLREHLIPGSLPSELDAILDDLPVGVDVDLDDVAESFIDALARI